MVSAEVISGKSDPIDLLVADGVPVRALIGHQVGCLEWLSAHRGERFRLCYTDDRGEVVTEDVSAAGLIVRGKELGWIPMGDELEPTSRQWLFESAAYHVRRGVHWYASATDQTDEMLPLAFPAAVLARAAERQEQRRRSAQRRLEADRARLQKRGPADRRRRIRALVSNAAQAMLERAQLAGVSLSAETAKRRARALAKEIIADVEAVRVQFTGDGAHSTRGEAPGSPSDGSAVK